MFAKYRILAANYGNSSASINQRKRSNDVDRSLSRDAHSRALFTKQSNVLDQAPPQREDKHNQKSLFRLRDQQGLHSQERKSSKFRPSSVKNQISNEKHSKLQ